MLFISIDDFYKAAKDAKRLSREEEKIYATKMMQGDSESKEIIIRAYYHLVASWIKRSPKDIQTLNAVYQCLNTLEKAVERFNFLQDNYTFTNHLSNLLRQSITRCLVAPK